MCLKFLALCICLHAIVGCKDGSNNDSGVGSKWQTCPLILHLTSIHVHVTSPTPLPLNLALSLNGVDVDVDECTNNLSSITVNSDRMQANVIFVLDGNPDDIEFYFPDGREGPQSNLMSLRFYSRATCSDTHIKFDEILAAQISWESIYANGEDCGVSYFAEGAVQTH